MISIIIPSRNRSYTLKRVLHSYLEQPFVQECILIDDAGEDDTKACFFSFQDKYPSVAFLYYKNEERRGAAYSRNRGIHMASASYILFGEDDAFLEKNYTQVCLEKLKKAEIVSGRLVLMEKEEDPNSSLKRFGNGLKKGPVFNWVTFSHEVDAIYTEDQFLPITHSLIMAKKALFLRYPYDREFQRGNGYREESTFQIKTVIGGGKVLVTNETHCMHLSPQEVKTGGQRRPLYWNFYWNLYYTHLFYKKYYKGIQNSLGIKTPRWIALLNYFRALFKEYSRAFFYSIKKRVFS